MTVRLLDLYCGAGGCAVGYHHAGFDEIVGVDIAFQKHYPFHFVQMNAIAAIDVLLCGGAIVDTQGREWRLSDFDAIHASPPCQGESIMRNLPWLRHKVYPLLIEPTREMLRATGLPYVIENVYGARYRPGTKAYGLQANWLCGIMFGLPFHRHRLFETTFFWPQPGHPKHRRVIRPSGSLGSRARDIVFSDMPGNGPKPHGAWEQAFQDKHPGASKQAEEYGQGSRTVGPRGNTAWANEEASAYGHARGKQAAAEAMGIFWMNGDELSQAIPPVYTEYIGGWLLKVVSGAVH